MEHALRVMLADDHESVREGLRSLFKAIPHMDVVCDVDGGDAAIEAVRAGAPDVLVMDLSMQPTNGLAVLRRMQLVRSRTRIVVLTRLRDAGYVREALSAGARGYVLKQSAFSELVQAILAVVRGEEHLDPALWRPDKSRHEVLDGTAAPSARELDVLRHSAIGESNQEIALALEISVKTVEVHKTRAMRKLGLHRRTHVVRYARLQGWLDEI
ncbi:MAG TPA: response regulator transcription factor [Vicinamibacterales bacterium]|nr:response regulator transcription factor [Vicinamibacterales bacterium]